MLMHSACDDQGITALVFIALGSFSFVGIGILAAILPLLYVERGAQMTFVVQSGLLLVSAVNVIEARWFSVVVVRTPGLLVLSHFAVRWASTVVFILVVGLIFYFVPNAEVRFRDVWVGAVVTGLLWRGALWGFSWYVHDMTRFNNVHGSVAAVVVFLIWVYISAVLLLYGVEVTAANARLRRHRPEAIPAAPAPRV